MTSSASRGPQSTSARDLPTAGERRSGPVDRRIAREDRRNAERMADDPNPRRDPECYGRRATDQLELAG
ncbi:MAG: hypothetical protein AAF515_12295 [Pseudomonadota bacterium]